MVESGYLRYYVGEVVNSIASARHVQSFPIRPF